MSIPLDPIPQYDPLIDSTGHMGERWYRWLSAVITRLLESPITMTAAHRAAQVASITTTKLITPTQPGAYRVSWTIQVTTAATVSSSISITITWKANGVAQSEAFPALTTNTTATHGFGSLLIYPTTANDISYATTYASVGGVPMAYMLDVTVEALT